MMSSLPDCRWALLSPRSVAVGIVVLWSCLVFRFATGAQPPLPAPELPAELSAAARDYRIEIYGAFRTNRAEYDARRKQGEALLTEWQTRGARPDEAAVLGRWFDEARRAASRQLPLPAPPNWNSVPGEALPIPPRLLPPHSPSPAPLLRAVPVARVRAVRQVQMTAISAGIMLPRVTEEKVTLPVSLPKSSSLGIVLELADSSHDFTTTSTLLPKSTTLAPTGISTMLIAAPASAAVVTATAPVKSDPQQTSNTPEEAAELNTAELRARIRGYDKAWRALQIDLFSEEELTLERADTLTAIMNDLGQARRDLLLYQAIAPAELRQDLRGLVALDELQKHLRQMIDTARANIAADQSLSQQQRAALDRAWTKLYDSQK